MKHNTTNIELIVSQKIKTNKKSQEGNKFKNITKGNKKFAENWKV